MALCGMESINWTSDSIKILEKHLSHVKKLQTKKILSETLSRLKTFFKFWRMKNLAIEVKVTVFKILALSKIIHLALVINVQSSSY